MKKLMFCFLAASLLAGCETVEISSPGSMKDIAVQGADECDKMIQIRRSALYLFWNYRLIGPDSTLAALQNQITSYAKNNNYDVVDMIIEDSSSVSAGLTSYDGFVGFFLGLGEVSGSAVLRKRNR